MINFFVWNHAYCYRLLEQLGLSALTLKRKHNGCNRCDLTGAWGPKICMKGGRDVLVYASLCACLVSLKRANQHVRFKVKFYPSTC